MVDNSEIDEEGTETYQWTGNFIEDYDSFSQHLGILYNKNTIKQYLAAFKCHYSSFKSKKMFRLLLVDVILNKNNNPLYRSFMNNVIECFDLPYKIPKNKKKNQNVKKEIKFIEKEKIDKLISGLPKRLSLFVRIYFETGLRLNELTSVERENISLDERTLSGIGKGNKPFTVRFSPTTAEILEKYLAQIDKQEYTLPFTLNKDYKNPGRMIHYYFKKECKKLGFNEKMHIHRLRYSLGHYLRVDKRWDLQQIKIKLRHSKLETTDIYTDASQEEVRIKEDNEVFE